MPRYQFSAQEYVNMVLIYAECNYDGGRALRMYAERYPNAHQPRNSRVIVSALVRIRNNEPVVPRRSGGPRPVISVRQEENVLRRFEEEPGSSTRKVGRLLNMSHVTVFEILKKNKQHPYSLQKVQGLLGPADFEQATRTRTKRRRPPQRPDKRHRPPKKLRTARYNPKEADSSSEEDGSGGDEDNGEHSTTEQVETLVVKEEPETYIDEPEVYVQLAGVKTEPDACGDDSDEPAVYIQLADVKTEPDACGDDSSDCETLAALSAAKRHTGSIKQRNDEAPPASCAAPSGQLPLPPDQQLKLHNPLTNQQGFS